CMYVCIVSFFFFSSRRRHTRFSRDWSSDVCSSDLEARRGMAYVPEAPALYDQFTPLEILRMGLSMYGIKRNDADTWCLQWLERLDRKSTRLNSSHVKISYAVFCLKKKN